MAQAGGCTVEAQRTMWAVGNLLTRLADIICKPTFEGLLRRLFHCSLPSFKTVNRICNLMLPLPCRIFLNNVSPRNFVDEVPLMPISRGLSDGDWRGCSADRIFPSQQLSSKWSRKRIIETRQTTWALGNLLMRLRWHLYKPNFRYCLRRHFHRSLLSFMTMTCLFEKQVQMSYQNYLINVSSAIHG